jgi:hypothetical protein
LSGLSNSVRLVRCSERRGSQSFPSITLNNGGDHVDEQSYRVPDAPVGERFVRAARARAHQRTGTARLTRPIMQYMLLVYGEDRLWQELPKEIAARLDDARDRWTQELVRSGHIRANAELHPTSTATTLRERDGRIVISDGPVAETGEVLGGYQLVECRDLDEALAIASRYPALRLGFSMEIRPVIPQ